MTRVPLTVGIWNEVFTNVTSIQFQLMNFPDQIVASRYYRIHFGSSTPALDTEEFIRVDLGVEFFKVISFTNSSAQNIYILTSQDGGAIIY